MMVVGPLNFDFCSNLIFATELRDLPVTQAKIFLQVYATSHESPAPNRTCWGSRLRILKTSELLQNTSGLKDRGGRVGFWLQDYGDYQAVVEENTQWICNLPLFCRIKAKVFICKCLGHEQSTYKYIQAVPIHCNYNTALGTVWDWKRM